MRLEDGNAKVANQKTKVTQNKTCRKRLAMVFIVMVAFTVMLIDCNVVMFTGSGVREEAVKDVWSQNIKTSYVIGVHNSAYYYMENDMTGERLYSLDASSIFKACVDNVGEGRIFVKAGTYEVAPDMITLDTHLTLCGEGKKATILKAKSNGTAILKHDGQATYLTIAHLGIDGNNRVDYCINFEQDTLRSAQLRLENLWLTGAKSYDLKLVDEDGAVTYGCVMDKARFECMGGYHRDYGSRFTRIDAEVQSLHLHGTTLYGIRTLTDGIGELSVHGCYMYVDLDTNIGFDARHGDFNIINVVGTRIIMNDCGEVLGSSGTGGLTHYATLKDIFIRFKADSTIVNMPSTYTDINSAKVWLENIDYYTIEDATLITSGESNECAVFGAEVRNEQRGMLQSGHTTAIYMNTTGIKTRDVVFPVKFPTGYTPRIITSVYSIVDAEDAVWSVGVKYTTTTGCTIVVNIHMSSVHDDARINIYWEAMPYDG